MTIEAFKGANARSPLKYHGGKFYLAPWIVSLMPLHHVYVEAYAGGGSVLFRKPPSPVEVINDIDPRLVNFWRVLADPKLFPEFQCQVAPLRTSQSLWEQSRDLLATGNGSEVDRAVAYFVFCRQSRSGQMQDFLTPSVRPRRGMDEHLSGWLTAIDNLPAVHARLQGAKIYNRPAIEVIREYDGPGVLFYLDPSYLACTRTAKSVYTFEMSMAQHAELLRVLLTVKGTVMLSGYDNPLYHLNLTPRRGWRMLEKQSTLHSGGGKTKRKKTECLWLNF